MSEVTVLDIPLQNSLTPRVGTYSEEGRSDTTFVYDSELEDYALTCSNTDSTGYFTYTLEPVNNVESFIISCDIKIINNAEHKNIISFNDGGTYPWFAIQKYYSSIDLRRQTGATATNTGANGIVAQVLNQWKNIVVKYTVGGVSGRLVSVFEFFVDGALTNTIRDDNTSTNKDYSIHKVTLLGTEDASSSCPNVLLKNVKISVKTSGNNFILFNADNEQLRAYASFPEEYASTLKGTINFEHLLTAEGILDSNNKYTYTIPLDNAINKSVIVKSPSINTQLTVDQSMVFDSSFNDYVIQTKYNSYSFEIFPNEPDTLGMDGIKKICIDYKICITDWNSNTEFFLMSLGGQDPANTGTSNVLSLTCTNTGKILNEFSQNPMSTNTFNPTDLSIQLNTIYKITIYAEINVLKNQLKVEVYIDNNLRYTGVSTPSSFSMGNFDACFFYKQWLSNSCKIKLGSINIYNGYPNTWYKKLNVKRNNSLYYLLASNTGLYPSRLRAKIDGTTYSILTKHDLDT